MAAPPRLAPEDGPICRLPPELLDMIAEWTYESFRGGSTGLCQNNKHGRKQLAHLRLAHRHFTYSKPLLASMFEYVELKPDPSKENFDWSFGGPYVKTVKFEALCLGKGSRWLGSDIAGGISDETFSSILNPQPDADEQAAGDAVCRYVESGQALLAFVRALKRFPRLRTVAITLANDFKGPLSPSAENLFDLAVQSLREANVKPTEMEFVCGYPDENMDQRLWQLPIWQDLKLERLETLMLSDDSTTPDPEDECDSLLANLEQCSGTLKSIELNVSHVRLWSQHSLIPYMPRLESIYLLETKISPDTIATWISHCPKLKRFDLHDTFGGVVEPDEARISTLEPVFHALRNHPSRIDFMIRDVWVNFLDVEADARAGGHFRLTNRSSNDASYAYSSRPVFPKGGGWSLTKSHPVQSEKEKDLMKMLNDYISGQGDWVPPANALGW